VWIMGDIEVHDPSAVVAEDDQSVEKPKRRGCHNEYVDRNNVSQVVLQKRAPGRGGDFRSPRPLREMHGRSRTRRTLLETTEMEPTRPACQLMTKPRAHPGKTFG